MFCACVNTRVAYGRRHGYGARYIEFACRCARMSIRPATMPVSRLEETFKLEAWCQRELSKLLNFSVEDELVSYLLSMQTAKDIEEYLTELLGSGGQNFQKEFFSHWHPPQRVPSPLTPQEGELLEELVRPQHEDMVLFRGEGGGGRNSGSNKGGKPKKESSSHTAAPPGFLAKTTPTAPPSLRGPWSSGITDTSKPHSHSVSSSNPPPGLPPLSSSASINTRSQRHAALAKKQKFVPLMSSEGQSRVAMHVPGRHTCQCLAQKHELINNCVECGRIICAQEGPGPCIFCGSLVFPPDEETMLAKDSKKAQKIKEKLIKQYQLQEGGRAFEHFKVAQLSTGLEKAVEHRDKLLTFDQTSAQRTHVLDDERDFFAVDTTSWASPEEKEALEKRERELREMKYGSRRNKTITLDIAGRKVVEDSSEIELYDEANVRDLKKKKKKEKTRLNEPATVPGDISNPSIPVQRPKFRFGEVKRGGGGGGGGGGGVKSDRDGVARSTVTEKVPLISRLQDRELQEMRDEGKCLSMHQPWASLLVEGVKRVEGRSWYTTHRGRLWIAAAAKVPSPEEIEEQCDFYRALYGEGVMFPCDFPTGCLLGCVDMTDCLSQDEYRDKYPEGESESPYVFICENPQQLIVKFPTKGDHKIWKLPKDIHAAAKAACRPSINFQQ